MRSKWTDEASSTLAIIKKSARDCWTEYYLLECLMSRHVCDWFERERKRERERERERECQS